MGEYYWLLEWEYRDHFLVSSWNYIVHSIGGEYCLSFVKVKLTSRNPAQKMNLKTRWMFPPPSLTKNLDFWYLKVKSSPTSSLLDLRCNPKDHWVCMNHSRIWQVPIWCWAKSQVWCKNMECWNYISMRSTHSRKYSKDTKTGQTHAVTLPSRAQKKYSCKNIPLAL